MCIGFVFNNEVIFSALFHTDNGFTCSDSGFLDLSTAQECSNAVNYATSFNKMANYDQEIFSRYMPKGCVIMDSGNMYFNLHFNEELKYGSNDAVSRSICKKGNS